MTFKMICIFFQAMVDLRNSIMLNCFQGNKSMGACLVSINMVFLISNWLLTTNLVIFTISCVYICVCVSLGCVDAMDVIG